MKSSSSFLEAEIALLLNSVRSATRVLKMFSKELLNPLIRFSTVTLVKVDYALGPDSPHNSSSVIDTD